MGWGLETPGSAPFNQFDLVGLDSAERESEKETGNYSVNSQTTQGPESLVADSDSDVWITTTTNQTETHTDTPPCRLQRREPCVRVPGDLTATRIPAGAAQSNAAWRESDL